MISSEEYKHVYILPHRTTLGSDKKGKASRWRCWGKNAQINSVPEMSQGLCHSEFCGNNYKSNVR